MGWYYAKTDLANCSQPPVTRDETPQVLSSELFVIRDWTLGRNGTVILLSWSLIGTCGAVPWSECTVSNHVQNDNATHMLSEVILTALDISLTTSAIARIIFCQRYASLHTFYCCWLMSCAILWPRFVASCLYCGFSIPTLLIWRKIGQETLVSWVASYFHKAVGNNCYAKQGDTGTVGIVAHCTTVLDIIRVVYARMI
jgi:hypothetical protein